MKIREYIDETGIPITRFADRCGLSFHQVYHILNGGVPTLRTAMAIEHYTKGQVSPKEMLSGKMFEEIYGAQEQNHKS